jgi:hypothetical protein
MNARRLAPAAAREISVFLFFAAWAVLVTRPLAFRLTTHTLPGPDPLSHLWMVSWLTGHAFQPSQLFHGNIFSPAPHAALMTDLSLGTAVLVLPLRLFTTEPLVLFNLATLIALAFGGWAFHALVFGLTRSRWAGLLAGLLAAFSPEQLAHVFHLNLLSIGWLALFVLGLHRIVERPSLGAILLAGVSGALNAQSSGYYAVSAAVVGLGFVAFHARALMQRRSGAALLAAASLAALLTAPYIHEFHELRDEQGGLRRPLPMSVQMAFQPGKDLRSTGYVYGRILGAQEGLFPGLIILALVPVALRRGGRAAWWLATAAALLVLLSLGPQLTIGGRTLSLPYRWLFDIPPFDSMRHPFTFAAVGLMLLAVLAGIGWSLLSLAVKPWAGPVVLALAALETLSPPPDLVVIPPGLPPAYQILESLPPGAVLEVPLFAPETVLWAARHGRPVLNGAGAFAPLQTLTLDRYIQNHWMEGTPADADTERPTPYLVGRFPVRYVILPAVRIRHLEDVAAAFERSRTYHLVAVASDGDRIYEVRRDAPAP